MNQLSQFLIGGGAVVGGLGWWLGAAVVIAVVKELAVWLIAITLLALGVLWLTAAPRTTIRQRRARIVCWLRGYHIVDDAGVAKFRFDCDGICHDCGRVGSGIPSADGE